jgi:hypothetical protein
MSGLSEWVGGTTIKIGKPSDFADSVADLRNELAHATGAEEPDAGRVLEYFVQLHRARLLFPIGAFSPPWLRC